MFLFKSKIPVVRNVIFENDDNTVTIIHSDGATKFNKEDILESHFSCDFHSSPHRQSFDEEEFIWLLLFLGGWMNTLLSIFPLWLWDEGFGRYNPQNLTNTPFWNLIIIVISSAILAILTFILFNYFLKFLRSKYDLNYPKVTTKDIFNVSLNNFTLKVRFVAHSYTSYDDYNEIMKKGYLKTNITSYDAGTKNLLNTLFYSNVKYIIILFTCLIVFYLSWDKPFAAWYVFEHNKHIIHSNFILNHKNTFLYWNYFTAVNPITAFVDGMLGVIFNFIVLIFSVALIAWSFVFVFGVFLFPFAIYKEVGIFSKKVIIKIIITAVTSILIMILGVGFEFFLIRIGGWHAHEKEGVFGLIVFSLVFISISFCIVSAVYSLVRYLIRKFKQ